MMLQAMFHNAAVANHIPFPYYHWLIYAPTLLNDESLYIKVIF